MSTITKNSLLLITSSFPFGHGETFLENEIEFLSSNFTKIIILSMTENRLSQRSLPANCIILPHINSKKKPPLSNFFNLILTKEIFHAAKKSPAATKIALRFWMNAINYSDAVKKTLTEDPSIRVIYSYWLNEVTTGALLTDCKSQNIKVISRAHGWDIYEHRHPYNYLPFRPFMSQKIDFVCPISKNGLDHLAPIFKNKTSHHRLGVLQPSPIEFDETDETEFKIISISNLIPLKRIALLIEALALFPNKKPIKWVHFGSGELFDNLKIKAENNLQINFEFKGQMTNDMVKDFLHKNNSSSVLINVSETEGIPVSMMEAMSFGIPCIGTNVGGVSEIIEHQKNGFLLPKNPLPEDIFTVLKKYLSASPETKKELRNNAFITWESKYNADINYPKFINEMINV